MPSHSLVKFWVIPGATLTPGPRWLIVNERAHIIDGGTELSHEGRRMSTGGATKQT